ncbi:MAG TPA: hypothetical protein VGN20_02590 [Mucilaginibacter sp.]|jgi:hypothetical protein
MVYIALDTCVWLELLKADTNQANNPFDELLFWIENSYITCITTRNLIAEWNRHKVSKKNTVLDALNSLGKQTNNIFSTVTPLDTLYTSDEVEKKLSTRIDRLDLLFNTIAEVAEESDDIFIKAAKRNLAYLAPNHTADSFRDTVNYMTLINYLIDKGYDGCYFSTINYTDFSNSTTEKYVLHNQLNLDFSRANLEYHFFENAKGNLGGKLFGDLRKDLPEYVQYLREQKQKEQKQKILEAEQERENLMDVSDPNFLSYSQQLDKIATKKDPDDLDKVILDFLFNRHPAYKNYFFRRLTENGVV